MVQRRYYAIGLQFSRSGIELASLSPHNDNLLDDGRASFVFPAFANEEYYVDLVAPAFRPPHWAFPAHIYFGPYMLEIPRGRRRRQITVIMDGSVTKWPILSRGQTDGGVARFRHLSASTPGLCTQ